ncbi:hypothetical protein KUTeg_001059 [Tegillarca granosa]|uniref:Uncharacterized protein n=1 Tax=Tegillarca granosa TaxID=220873 RepID=A0ABQ9FX51_TEGGR|nr:hypothetical protein KUTeg_001059 [Tegillarca granosa]
MLPDLPVDSTVLWTESPGRPDVIMPWQITPLKLTFYRPRWKLFVILGLFLFVILSIIHICAEIVIKCPACRSIKLFHSSHVEIDFDFRQYMNMSWNNQEANTPLLTLFTTWNPTMQKPIVYNNALRNWASLSPNIKTVVFSNNSDVSNIAKRYGWKVLPITKTACFGTPVLRTMFQETIKRERIFNEGLVKTLTEITLNPEFALGPILVVGKRVDVNISKLHEPVVNSTRDVDNLARSGKLSWGFAGDYYFTNDLFPWEYVPDLVIGRPLVDNWLIWYARQIGAKVIDTSGTVLAVHQLANGLKRIKFMCNKAEMWKRKLLPNLPLWKGMIECAGYESRLNTNGEVIILPKLLLQEICKHDETNHTISFGLEIN